MVHYTRDRAHIALCVHGFGCTTRKLVSEIIRLRHCHIRLRVSVLIHFCAD